jgi:hypothetical protein
MSKRLEILEKALEDLKVSNRSAWDIYGSELCAGTMIEEEEKLEKKIATLKKPKSFLAMKRSKTTTKDWTRLIDKSVDSQVRDLYLNWKSRDGTMVGLARILMIQEINWSIKQKGNFYYGQYDALLKALIEKYSTL